MVENAIHASRGEFGNLALGISEFYAFHPVVSALIRAYKSRYPGTRFRLAPLLSGDIIQQIDAGLLNGGFVFSMESRSSTLHSLPLLKERLLLAVSATSSLAKQKSCTLSMIHGADLILAPREQTPRFYDRLVRQLRDRGVVPSLTLEGSNHSAIMALVAAGLGCAFVPLTARFTTPPDVTLIEIEDCDVEVAIDLVWKSQSSSATLDRFLELMREASR
jgi:DNA-binding transcriptional LysR family regulator